MEKSRRRLSLFVVLILLGSCIFAQTDVLTQHNDLGRTGWNNKETQLKVSNVSPSTFGLLFKQTVDDQIYAQPLIASGITIGGVSKNVVYVCTVNNTIYAFDADNGSLPAYWTISLTPANMRPPNVSDVHAGCNPYVDFTTSGKSAQFGIVGTPVIDKSAKILYVVSRWVDPSGTSSDPSWPPNGFHQFLHAIDLATGADKISPVEIQATINGTGPGNNAGRISFDPRRQNQRGGLLLLNGVIYILYAAHCDWDIYYGWMFAYNASNLQKLAVFCPSPNDGRGGIWMSGGGPAAEQIGNGNIYLATGNGNNRGDKTLDPFVTSGNLGESVLRLTPNSMGTTQSIINAEDHFTPFDYHALNDADDDFASQVMMIPGTNFLVTGCKDGFIYVLDKTNLGGFDPAVNHIVQQVSAGSNAQFHTSLAYFGGANKQFVYQFAENQNLSAYPLNSIGLDAANTIVGNVQGGTGNCGSYMSVSSNGSDESTGILWITNAKNPGCNANGSTCTGIMYAVKASDVTQLLWSSNINPGDAVGNFAKTACPTIANGKVYLATFSNALNVYGLLASNPQCVNNVALNKSAVASTPAAGTTNDASQAFDGDVSSSWTSANTDPQTIYVDLGASYDICKVAINWTSYATEYYLESTQLEPVANPSSWTIIDHITGNSSSLTQTIGSFTGRYIRMRGITHNGTSFSISEMQVYGQLSATCAAPVNLTATATQNTAHLSWDPVPGAKGYNVTYRSNPVISLIARNNLTSNSLDITALSCGTSYKFFVQTICSGNQLSALSPGSFNSAVCTTSCGVLPTRHSQVDIGDIGVAGKTCYSVIAPTDSVYTLSGSGMDIGGTNDEFQMMYYDRDGDNTDSVRVTSQDAVNPNNKAGIMMKESISSTAPFAFVGITSGAGAFFMYRVSDGGEAVSTYLPGVTAPYYLKLQKIGTKYAGFVSSTGLAGDWQQIGTTIDLGFGTGTVEEGFAVTSADNTKLSTAEFETYQNSAPLPITLISFTAQNVNNQYVALHWTTAMEVNNDHFAIERSTDGIHFDLIATQKTIGNSNINQYYNYSDLKPADGVNFYRLQQFDIDGRMTEFPVVQVNFGLDGLPVVYPNPAKQTIYVASGKEVVRFIRLISMEGKEIAAADNSANLQVIKLNVSSLSSGVYMLEIKTDSKIIQQKVLKE